MKREIGHALFLINHLIKSEECRGWQGRRVYTGQIVMFSIQGYSYSWLLLSFLVCEIELNFGHTSLLTSTLDPTPSPISSVINT